MARARRAIKDPWAPRVVRRLPAVAAGLAALALLGGAVGGPVQLGAGSALDAVPAGSDSAELQRQVSRLATEQVSQAGAVAAVREVAADRTAADEATEQKVAEKEAAEKKAAEKKAAEKKAAEKKAAEKKAAEEEAAEEQAAEEAEEQGSVVGARQDRESRSSGRDALQPADLGAEDGSRWTTVDLNARAEPAQSATLLDVLDAGSEMTVTERTSQDASQEWRQIELDGRAAWVAEQYLVAEEPSSESQGSGGTGSEGGVSGAECAGGSGVESGLQPNAVAVHRAICHAFPSITSYGGVRADSIPGHPDGRAVDAMLPDHSGSGNALGWEVAEYVRANAGELGVTEVIFDSRIWTTQRSGEGWRSMGDRGGDTANHRDHVHVTVG